MKNRVPYVPGDVGNATTFDFPVLYRVVEELTIEKLIVKADPSLAEHVIREARALEQSGVCAITSDCGYMALFQEQVAAAVRIPVFLSSLMQLPFICRMLSAPRKVGVIVADSRYVRKELFMAVGVDAEALVVIAGMEKQVAFRSAVIDEVGVLDTDAVQKEIVTVAHELVRASPEVGAILLECSDFPPYAAYVQEVVRLPVFDFVTMIRYVHLAFAQLSYQGSLY